MISVPFTLLDVAVHKNLHLFPLSLSLSGKKSASMNFDDPSCSCKCIFNQVEGATNFSSSDNFVSVLNLLPAHLSKKRGLMSFSGIFSRILLSVEKIEPFCRESICCRFM